jgi:molybdopterin-guanine dinucleotide biosynthesis protein A
MSGVSGLVLAGGHSARLGTDKRVARLGGITLLDRAIDLLAGVADEVMVAVQHLEGVRGDPGASDATHAHLSDVRSGVPIIADWQPDRGPMAGILAGLQHARCERVLVIPVDMPMLTAAFLRFLVGVDPDAAVTVPSRQIGLEPLVAVYHVACAPAMIEFMTHGTAAVHAFINATALRVHRVEERDIRRHGEPDRLFLNINTPEDLTRAETMLHGSPPQDVQQ